MEAGIAARFFLKIKDTLYTVQQSIRHITGLDSTYKHILLTKNKYLKKKWTENVILIQKLMTRLYDYFFTKKFLWLFGSYCSFYFRKKI